MCKHKHMSKTVLQFLCFTTLASEKDQTRVEVPSGAHVSQPNKKIEGAYICLQQQEGSTFSVHTKNRKTSRKCLTIANYVFDVAPLSFDFADMTLDTAPLIIYEWCLLGAVSTFSCLHGRIRTQRGNLIKSCHKHKAKESEKT